MHISKIEIPKRLTGAESAHNGNGEARFDRNNGGPPLDSEFVDQRHALQIAIRDSDLSPRVKFVGLAVTTFMGQDASYCNPGYRRLAKITGYSINKIRELAEALHEACLMCVKFKRGRGGTSYSTSLDIEDAIAIYGRKQNRPSTVIENRKMSLPKCDIKNPIPPEMSPGHDQECHSQGVTKLETGSPKMSPEAQLMSPKEAKMSPPGGDRRKKTEDRESGGRSETVVTPKSGDHDNVVNLQSCRGTDAQLLANLRNVLAPFGPAADMFLQDIVNWTGRTPQDVATDVVCWIGSHGSANVRDAWEATRMKAPQLKAPGAYFQKTLRGMSEEHGKRDIVVSQDVRRAETPLEFRRRQYGTEGLR